MSMDTREASKMIHKALGAKPWLVMVGEGVDHGRPCVVVYVTKKAPKDLSHLRDLTHGRPVVIKRTGSIGPLR
jgi:hypothetical protein